MVFEIFTARQEESQSVRERRVTRQQQASRNAAQPCDVAYRMGERDWGKGSTNDDRWIEMGNNLDISLVDSLMHAPCDISLIACDCITSSAQGRKAKRPGATWSNPE